MPGSSKWSLSLSFPHQNPVYMSPHPIHATCHTRLILLDLFTQIIFGEDYRSLSYLLCSFLHSPVTSSLLGPNFLLSTLFSNTLSLLSSLNASNLVSHSYKTTDKIIVLYILIFIFLDNKLEDKKFSTKWQQAFPDFNLLLISSWTEFGSFGLIPNIWTLPSCQSNYCQSVYYDFVLHCDLKTRTYT